MFSAFLFYVVVLVDSDNVIVVVAAANVAIPHFYFFYLWDLRISYLVECIYVIVEWM